METQEKLKMIKSIKESIKTKQKQVKSINTEILNLRLELNKYIEHKCSCCGKQLINKSDIYKCDTCNDELCKQCYVAYDGLCCWCEETELD